MKYQKRMFEIRNKKTNIYENLAKYSTCVCEKLESIKHKVVSVQLNNKLWYKLCQAHIPGSNVEAFFTIICIRK